MELDLQNAYRPLDFSEMYGQSHIVSAMEALQKNVKSGKGHWPHSYLFVGEAGSGKTTTARIIASKVGCDPKNIIEVDAATYTSIDSIRELTASVRYKALGNGNNSKVFIIDEVHRLSKQAFDALLKTLEEPPSHVYFVLCTTDSAKVPKTVVSRCLQFVFKPLSLSDLSDLIEDTAQDEEITLPKGSVDLIAKASQGSPRMALTALAKCRGAKTKQDVAELVEGIAEEGEIIELARMICTGKGFNWGAAVKIVKNLENENPESVRMVIVSYVTKMILGTNSEEKVLPMLNVLASFSKPFSSSEKMAPVLLAIGELLFEVEED